MNNINMVSTKPSIQKNDFVIRPVRESDLPAILRIAKLTGPGFNSLPDNQQAIERKINQSLNSFSEKLERKERYYLFVLESIEEQIAVGTSGIDPCIGYPWPFYRYRISTMIQVSQILHKRLRHQMLHVTSDHQEATELGALYLKPEYRGQKRGTLLSRSRCLFIAQFPELFSDYIIADMRGISDKNSISPFWESIGQHFYDMSYKEASYLKATEGAQFITELIPSFPIYVDLLPEDARQVIGKTHENTTPALHVLEKEGFRYRKYIDIFDAGPTLGCSTRDLKTVKESKVKVVSKIQEKLSEKAMVGVEISNVEMADFRAIFGALEEISEEEVMLETKLAKALNVSVGDKLRYCFLN